MTSGEDRQGQPFPKAHQTTFNPQPETTHANLATDASPSPSTTTKPSRVRSPNKSSNHARRDDASYAGSTNGPSESTAIDPPVGNARNAATARPRNHRRDPSKRSGERFTGAGRYASRVSATSAAGALTAAPMESGTRSSPNPGSIGTGGWDMKATQCAATGHCPHRGARATQTVAPRSIRAWFQS